ncbi:hypothetical protein [Clostridium ganghwense]|uniref:Uncharacterized protein n=1 Tax=Clostridium ganghwense TaxID=312089 RepID=A0ABT4CM36_9CLOT|nr:hypothetical protein [Clostridium ganghwense]MCY6370119.1 hypothetical protein [Clostridium ganghwense]
MRENNLKVLNRFRKVRPSDYEKQTMDIVLDKFIEGYTTNSQLAVGGFCLHKQIKYLLSMLENEKEIHIKNNESLDKIINILQEELKREDIIEEERKDIYRLLNQICSSYKESQLQKAKHVTSRLIAAMGIASSVAISLGTVLIHEKYKTKREREKWNNY